MRILIANAGTRADTGVDTGASTGADADADADTDTDTDTDAGTEADPKKKSRLFRAGPPKIVLTVVPWDLCRVESLPF